MFYFGVTKPAEALPCVCWRVYLLSHWCSPVAALRPNLPGKPKAASVLPKPAAERQKPAKDISVRTEAWFKDCKQGWDAATHMTKRDYERTCLRMARERMKFMRDWEKPGDRSKAK